MRRKRRRQSRLLLTVAVFTVAFAIGMTVRGAGPTPSIDASGHIAQTYQTVPAQPDQLLRGDEVPDTAGDFDVSRESANTVDSPTSAWEELLAAGGVTGEVPYSASGNLTVVPGERPPEAADRVWTVRVEVEDGVPVSGAAFADIAMTILNDPRGWGADGSISFAKTTQDADIRLILAAPATVDQLCAPLSTRGYTSCRVGDRAVINAQRWELAASPFLTAGGSIPEYREYVVNHEVGHALGHGHRTCPGPGQVAPVMLQQTVGLGGCRTNGWPNP